VPTHTTAGAMALLLSTLLAACGGPETKAAEAAITASQANPVVVASEVAPAAPNGLILTTGKIVYDRETVLAFKTGGVIASVLVDEGDLIKAGQPLARLNMTELSAGLAQAEASVANADAQYERTRALVEKGHVAQARLDDAALARDQARANLDAVSFNRNQGVIIAGTNGVVLRRFADGGQTVAPGAAILQIGEMKSGLVLRVPVSAPEAATLKSGDAADVTIRGLEDTARKGSVVRIAAKSDEATGNFEVDIKLDDDGALRSGMVAEARITATAPAGAPEGPLRIPSLALLDARADQGYVYVLDDKNIARRRAIATSGIDSGDVLVVSGLKSGERIVAEGAAYVRDGEAVTVADRR